ncbi:bifunctional 4-hydroxy-2-oxoglutarate aldolase/2-dehydro-3-deoxy-phosphogluconate aldolase [uncultured Cohaesibacter sp.]|uniref:bifunctional 4-hydroxy-2-oxoglutarate aldolase/2-dehydro-3-deoxy-phosphogluconate aldolase n=1 Tax=uncultured Cohaesibacter sp. TaxID=1002546 RepID=UPI0029C636E3|nr:bifunctional 4-hydroxy-2-oxoglutarate aldolase/2-dehydro-3-deoxy-phosphogluconate aldolase [uncultured Cohaesibacter sp.]
MRTQVSSLCKGARVIPVVVIDKVEDAVPLASCLVENGMPVVEVTMRTEAALAAVEEIAKHVPECVIGVGSILTPQHLSQAQAAGGHFGVSPGTSQSLLRALEISDWPFLPGAATLSEMLTLRDAGIMEQKLFPAAVVGGVNMLKSVAGPVSDISFCPTGGVKPENANDFLSLSNVFAVGGTWIAPLDDVNNKNWNAISERAAAASKL